MKKKTAKRKAPKKWSLLLMTKLCLYMDSHKSTPALGYCIAHLKIVNSIHL